MTNKTDAETETSVDIRLNRGEPCVVLFDGKWASIYFDTFRSETGDVVRTPTEVAVAVARLRSLADEIAKTPAFPI